MERNERPQRMLARMAELFDLPADIVAGLCHVEMLGDRQLFLEGHSGSYPTEQSRSTWGRARSSCACAGRI